MRLLATLALPLALLALALVLKAADPSLVERLRLAVFDAYQQLSPRESAGAPVRIVEIDDASLERIGQWPWPRRAIIDLLDRLDERGAAAVGLSVVFAEPDRSSPDRMLRELRDVPGFVLEAPPRALLYNYDAALAQRLGELTVATSFALTRRPNAARPAVRWGLVTAGGNPLPFLPAFEGAVVNIPRLAGTAPGNGGINVVPDADGIVRSLPLFARLDDAAYPSLAAELLRIVQGASTHVVRLGSTRRTLGLGGATGIDSVRIGTLELPTTPDGGQLIHFAGHRPERFVPAWQVLEGRVDPALIEGHLVLVGVSAAGLADVVATPLDPAALGIEVQAEYLEQVLEGRGLERPDWAHGVEALFLVLGGIALIVILMRLGAASGAVLGTGVLIFTVAMSVYAFREHRLLLDPVLPLLALIAVYLVMTVQGYWRTEAERAEVRRAFSLYLAPELVRRVAANPDQLKLGGEARELTILFCDIRGFTTLAETMTAEQLTRFINRFLTPMTDAIQDHAGTIDKYMGDAVMAFWNAPLDVPDHAARAVAAALEMRRRLTALNAELAAEAAAAGRAHLPVRIGIGLNTGVCSVGNMGSERRFSYSAIGDPVNLAARFEGQCKAYGVDVLVSERTRAGAGEVAAFELDRIRVMGTTRGEAIFALLGDAALAARAAFRDLEAAQADLLDAYRRQDWDAAEHGVARCRGHELAAPLDAYYALMAGRIAHYRENPPPPDWDGVDIATSK